MNESKLLQEVEEHRKCCEIVRLILRVFQYPAPPFRISLRRDTQRKFSSPRLAFLIVEIPALLQLLPVTENALVANQRLIDFVLFVFRNLSFYTPSTGRDFWRRSMMENPIAIGLNFLHDREIFSGNQALKETQDVQRISHDHF